jgi:LysM repeat protein
MRKLIAILALSASLALAAPNSVVVQSGDTIGSIAARNGVSVQALLKANNLSATSTLKIGQVIKIPGGLSSQKTGSITVQSGDTLGSIANRYGVSVATLKSINGLDSDNVSVGQVLRLSGASAKPKPSASSSNQKAKSGTVIVQAGDTLGEIAQANNTTVAALKSLNNLSSNDLKLGQVLKVSGSSATTTKSSSKTSTASSTGTVTVKAGDTLGEIAQANNISIAKLKALNDLSSNNLKLGQVLKISGSNQNTTKASNKTTTTSSTTTKTTVTVKAGDSLSKIALANGTTIAALRSANKLSSDDLKLGQVLKIPGSKPANSSAKTTTAKTPNTTNTPNTIKVQKGDNLSKIAKQYNLSIDKLRKLNDLKSDDLALGQILKLKAPTVAKTNKPSKPSSNATTKTSTAKTSTAKTDKPLAKTNQTKPATSSKPTATSKVNPSATTSKTPANTSTKPAVNSNKPPVSAAKKPELAKNDPNKPVTNQKPSPIKTSSNPAKPTVAVQEAPKAAAVALKPIPVKPTPTSTKPVAQAPKPQTLSAPKPQASNPQTSSPKPTQPNVDTQPNKPVMNEATVQDPPAQNSAATTSPQPIAASDASSPSSVTGLAAVSSINAQTETPLQNLPPISEVDQSQSGVGSDADYIIIEPQNSLEVIGQRTGSVASTTPAKPPTNTTPQQIAKYNRERLLWPLQGVLTSYYGYRSLRIGRSHFHTGLDIAAPRGTPVYAALSGRVEQAGWSRVGYGKLVIIRGWDGRRYYYGHNSRLLVKAGQWVNQGTMISRVGSTGYATGPHLHFEVRVGGHTRNPIAYLPRSQVQFARYAPKR